MIILNLVLGFYDRKNCKIVSRTQLNSQQQDPHCEKEDTEP